MKNKLWIIGAVALALVALSACGGATPAATTAPTEAVMTQAPTEAATPVATEAATAAATAATTAKVRIGVVLDTGGENDKSFNEYTLKGARDAATALGLNTAQGSTDFGYVVSESTSDYGKNINNFITEGYNFIVTVGFLMGDDTAKAAVANPKVNFAIVDYQYFPDKDGHCYSGDTKSVKDCYQEELPNVTSLMFSEDQVGYLAGTLAGCMTKTNVVATVSGMEIPPVVRYVTGFQNGAKAVNPNIKTLNTYIPDFNDPATGKQVGQQELAQNADVIFGVGGNTGNGGLLAAFEKGVMAIGVDVDQYFTYPEVKSALITSAQKNMDVATRDAIKAFAAGTLKPGASLATLANGGIGLAPYHDWDSKIPQTCKDKVDAAKQGLISGSITTGYKP